MDRSGIREKRRHLAGILLLACGLFLTACSLPGRGRQTSLAADETGRITSRIVEPQGEEAFTREELEAYIGQEIDRYNKANPGAVTLEKAEIKKDTVKISMTYAGYRNYAEFNGMDFFLGTLQKAGEAGYDWEKAGLEGRDGKAADLSVIRDRSKEWKVMVVSEAVTVKVPDKILYVSDNVDVTGRTSAVVRSVRDKTEPTLGSSLYTNVASRLAYIVYK